MIKELRKSEAGVTLLELLLVMALLGILFAIVSGFFLQALALYGRQSGDTAVQSDLRYAMDYMVRELRTAKAVLSITENGSKITYTAGQGTPSTRYFQLRGSTIQRYDNQPLCQYVGSLQFAYDNETAKAAISLSSVTVVPGRNFPYNLYTSVVLRNAPR